MTTNDLIAHAEANGFICTDPGCLQFQRDNGDGSFDQLEVRRIGTGPRQHNAIAMDVIVPDDYDEDIKEGILRMYNLTDDEGNDVTDFRKVSSALMAECIFEMAGTLDVTMEGKYRSMDDEDLMEAIKKKLEEWRRQDCGTCRHLIGFDPRKLVSTVHCEMHRCPDGKCEFWEKQAERS